MLENKNFPEKKNNDDAPEHIHIFNNIVYTYYTQRQKQYMTYKHKQKELESTQKQNEH